MLQLLDSRQAGAGFLQILHLTGQASEWAREHTGIGDDQVDLVNCNGIGVKEIKAGDQSDYVAEYADKNIGIAQPDALKAGDALLAQAIACVFVEQLQGVVRCAAGAYVFSAGKLFF